ncbi:MAG: choice-of-anchor J domain-containing protein [Bacteroidetes bacterium]|nr:choice-of-anchor J domain-containing protein [Bacteroidota bacterium]
MYPNAVGSTLAASFAVGDTISLSFADAVPAYAYGFDQLAVVGFVQDDATKEVKQTALSEPLVLPNYAVLKNCNPPAIPPLTCSSTVNGITVEIPNKGANTLTTCDINYSVDGGAVSTYNWTGSLAPGATTTATLSAVSISGNGSHSMNINAANANGAVNPQCADTRTNLSFVANITGTVPPVTELFSAVTFPPAGWGRYDASADNTGWTRSTAGSGGNNGSAKMDYYSSAAGNIDELYLPSIDLTGVNAASLTFKICKAPYSGYTDNLKVNVSTDCGATWNTLWNKSDPALSTVAALGTAFTPGGASTWRLETVDLVSLLGQVNSNIVFKATSGYGNNGYLDEINVTITTGVGENQLEEQISLFPTPSTGTVFLNLSAIKDNTVRISISDVTGKVVDTYTAAKSNQHELKMEKFQNGTYTINIDADGQRITKKVVLNK